MASSTKIFSLEGKGLKLTSAADFEPYLAELRALEDVEEIRLHGNTLGVEACRALGEVLATKESLRIANLADIFTGRLLSEIPEALDHLLTSVLNLPNLRIVNLNDNAFGINTVKPLLPFLSSHVPLQHLHLNNNGLGPHAGILVAEALSALHAKKEEARKAGQDVPHLETIVCGRNRLENGSMTAWAKALSLHHNVKQIKMVQNGIRQEGISHLLSEGLNHATQLKVLDLQDNTFTLSGAKALAKVVPSWTEIEELGVGDSLLGAKGSVLVAAALARGKNPKLEILRLQYNEINSLGMKGFADATKDALPALRKIEVNGNRFTEEDESILALRALLDARKETIGGDFLDEDAWGVDSLSDLEDDDSDEEGDEDQDDDEDEDDILPEDKAEKLLQEAEEAQEEPTVQLEDPTVDKLADTLNKTHIHTR